MGPALPIACLLSRAFPGEAHPGGLTFVERCLSGLVGNVRLSPSLEQRLEAVQVSPARGQVKGRFLLQGALVDDGRVCWGEQVGSSQKEKIPPPPQHKDNPNFHPIPTTDACDLHLNLSSILLALDLTAFTGLFQLPSHINSAQMLPPLGSLPWLSRLPL